MFGNNPIRHVVRDPSQLEVTDMFYTIQGEGPYSGCPALFIRLAGCNLACHFCDTEFEKGIGEPRSIGDLVAEIQKRWTPVQRRLVVITGGEPLRQDFSKLVEVLFELGTHTIQIETAGTLWQPSLQPFIVTPPRNKKLVLVCSPKTPRVHPMITLYCKHYKYIITAGEVASDGLPNKSTQTPGGNALIYRASPGTHAIWVSPCDSYDERQNDANVAAVRDVALQFGYRVSLQTHKLLGVE